MKPTACCVALVAACSGDDLGKAFQPSDPKPPQDVYGPPSPIENDTTLVYFFAATSDNDSVSTIGQQSAAGYLCLRVDAVKDTAIEAYKNAAQTLVTARVKVNGGVNAPDIVVTRVDDNGGQPNPVPGNPSEAEALLAPLWLRHLTVPLRNHGFAQAAMRDFPTRHSPRPTGASLDQTLLKLPFFEVRGSLDQTWCGWDNSPPDWPERYPPGTPAACYDAGKGSSYYQASFTRYFFDQRGCTPPYGSADDQCEFEAATPPHDCPAHTDATGCGTAGCTWYGAEGCVGLMQLTMTWRGDAVDTVHYTGAVLHQVRFRYDVRGVLHGAEEIMVPDSSPSSPVDHALGGCIGGFCAQATLDLGDAPWAEASCTF